MACTVTVPERLVTGPFLVQTVDTRDVGRRLTESQALVTTVTLIEGGESAPTWLDFWRKTTAAGAAAVSPAGAEADGGIGPPGPPGVTYLLGHLGGSRSRTRTGTGPVPEWVPVIIDRAKLSSTTLRVRSEQAVFCGGGTVTPEVDGARRQRVDRSRPRGRGRHRIVVRVCLSGVQCDGAGGLGRLSAGARDQRGVGRGHRDRERDGVLMRDGLRIFLGALVFVLVLGSLVHYCAGVASAQETVYADKVAVGTPYPTPTVSPLTVTGLPTGQSGAILRAGTAGLIGTGPLVIGDIPGVFTQSDANETITGAWTFTNGPHRAPDLVHRARRRRPTHAVAGHAPRLFPAIGPATSVRFRDRRE